MLCLHGFSGTPFEVLPVCEALAKAGLSVSAPVIAGHGTTVTALGKTGCEDWLASAITARDRLLTESGSHRLAVVGFSMGGLLALRLAQMFPEQIAALVVLAAPLRLPRIQVAAVRALSRLPRALFGHIPKLGGFDIIDAEMKRMNPGLPALPVAGVASLIDLGAMVCSDLGAVYAPTLIVHGEKDRTVPISNSMLLAASLPSAEVEQLRLPRSGHLCAIDVDREEVAATATQFVSRFLP